MYTTLLEPRKAINKAFLKIKPSRTFIETFKTNLIQVLDRINEKESEEFHKNLVIEFLKKTYYDPNYFVNTKGRNDLVIHNGKEPGSPVGVIVEAKSPINKSEMISVTNLNKKALQELVYYYMRERITHKNTELKNLVVTNIYEWFIFDAQLFNKLFAENKAFVKQFIDFENKRTSGSSTDYFYKEIAEPFITSLPATIEFTHFDIRNYDKPLRNADKEDDKQLIALYKLLSPQHFLKLSFANDSNSLDKNFYTELLHIIGLTETKEGGKKLIQRNKLGQRFSGSLLENTIMQLDSMDKLSRLENPKYYGANSEERLFAVALELTITWVNRILFLKLLEAQLLSYQKRNCEYSFLNSNRIKDYDNLNTLFFQVLAKKSDERNPDVQQLFNKVPYLNSSLFEMTDMEHNMFPISQLEDNKTLPFISSTVIKDSLGKKKLGDLNALHYFFSFLDSYDFASEGSEDIQEDNKTLISASVLGLIFEKINGYKDGSFFTPGFITMYMCREAIRKSVVQKFNEAKGWDCKTFLDLQNKKYEISEANEIIDSLKICDPAVGSGHFLVSALNEIISIKSKLEILRDSDGRLLKNYQIIIENDELMIFDDRDGSFFQYNPLSEESRRVQETLFKEKRTIIENCLFGVDINTNSVKICRLRLWIELLKNAYYKGPDFKELETLPNIDINIKPGNSLISRFPLESDLKTALKQSKWTIEEYKSAVTTYQNAESKDEKRQMIEIIDAIKNNFETNIDDPFKKKIAKARGDVEVIKTKTNTALQWGEQISKELKLSLKNAESKLIKLEKDKLNILSNIIYEDSFEWRFEFPQVLDNEGKFLGFDTIIGNPPYIQLQKMGQASLDLEKMGYDTFVKTGDIYSLFYELGFRILKANGFLAFITSNKWMRAAYGESLRRHFVERSNPVILIDFGGMQVFDTATVDTNILIAEKAIYEGTTKACVLDKNFSMNNTSDYFNGQLSPIAFNSGSWTVLNEMEQKIKNKIESLGTPLKEWKIQINYGIKTGFNEAFIIDENKKRELIEKCPEAASIIRPILRGRDIQKYTSNWAGLYLINTHTGYKNQNGDIVPPIDLEKYPPIKDHLDKYYTQLTNRQDKGITHYHLRSCIYTEDFFKPKIIYPEITKFINFYLDRNNHYFINNKCFILTGMHIEYLTCFFNSKLFRFCFTENFPELMGGTRELRKIFFEKIPIMKITNELNEAFKCRIAEFAETKNEVLKEEINLEIFNLYNLSQDEINFINLSI
jgi:adenine-specific DNA-methyltransferase